MHNDFNMCNLLIAAAEELETIAKLRIYMDFMFVSNSNSPLLMIGLNVKENV